MNHSPEPWSVSHENCIKNECGLWIEVPAGPHTATRIVACVNFLAGIPTEELNTLMAVPHLMGNVRDDIDSAIMATRG